MKTNNIIVSFTFLFMIIIVTCNIVRDNPLDEAGSAYIPPSLLIDTSQSSVLENDTIHFDTATIVLKENDYKCEFRYKYADSLWSAWTDNAFWHMKNLRDTSYTINIASRYKGV